MFIQETDSRQVLLRAQKLSQDIINDMHLISDDENWNEEVSEVLVLLSASRSGSSLIFQALANAPGVIAPAGEHEPWLFLSENKHPFTNSDYISSLHNKHLLLKLLRNDLLVRDGEAKEDELACLIRNRLLLRQNIHNVDTKHIEPLMDALDVPPVISPFYWPIENPPYIDQPLARRASLDELREKTLLFKSPSDAYRPGLYESLFPNAKINYIHLTRGFAQTVNGLMDGWNSNEVDFISNAVGSSVGSLNIKEYSNTTITRNYWCFDLFPDWESYTCKSLFEVCSHQWLSAHQSILRNYNPAIQIRFEDFYLNKEKFVKELRDATGINTTTYDWQRTVMSTEKPQQFRWKKRANIFQNLHKHLGKKEIDEVKNMQEKLGYSMEEATWV